MLAAALATEAVPPRLASYRSWTEVTPGPRLVPYALAAACLPAMGMDLAQARKTHGPHTNRWVAVYANPAATEELKTKDAPFPAGAIMAKEKRLQPDDAKPEGVAFMIKHGKGEFAESGGWEFRFYPSPGSQASYSRCIACHRAGAAKDYVFTTVDAAQMGN